MNKLRQNPHFNLDSDDVKKVIALYDKHDEVPYISPNRDLKAWLTAVDLGTESLVPKRNTTRLADDSLPGHIILLWRIGFGTFTTESPFPKYFEYDYGIDGAKALEDVQEMGYARKFSATESLNHLPATYLKAYLKKKGIKGYSALKKDGLMEKVREVYEEPELVTLFSLRGFVLTEAGEEMLNTHASVVDRHPKKSY